MATLESRKRARTEENEGTRAKKRAVTEERNIPGYPNGTPTGATPSNEPDEPKDNDSLEMFRKDAIYRRMKHYSRENDRGLTKIAELERRRHTCEAGLAALEACWSQIVDTIKSLVRLEDLPSVDVKSEEIYDLSAHVSADSDPTYVDSLRTKVQATQHLITAFVQLGGKEQSVLSSDEVYTQCQRAQTQCSSLRSEVSLMRARLSSSESEKEKLHEELVAAHARIDRLQSKTVAVLNNTSANNPSLDLNDGGIGGSGSGEVKKDEESPTPSSPSAIPSGAPANGVHAVSDASSATPLTDVKEEKEVDADTIKTPDTDKTTDDIVAEWKAIADVRDKRIEGLQQECVQLRGELAQSKVMMRAPSVEFIKETAIYKHLYDTARDNVLKEEARQKELSSCKEELETLSKMKQDWQTELTNHYEKVVNDYKALSEKRGIEIARIREQRDQFQFELNERKQKDTVKLTSLNEWRTLAESRGDRVQVLLSEVTRLKARLATQVGDEDLMTFLFSNSPHDVSHIGMSDDRISETDIPAVPNTMDRSYVLDLRKRLSTAEARVAALEATIEHLSEEHPDAAAHARAEAEAREQVSQLQKRVQEYEDVFGSTSKDEAVRKMEEELKRLRVSEKQRAQAETSLYTELDKLSAAWELLDKQVKNKVFDLSALEEKVQRSLVERAKLETKYYAAMRDKESLETERKNLARNVEKQGKMIESLHASDLFAKARISSLETQAQSMITAAEHDVSRIAQLEQSIVHLQATLETETKRANGNAAQFKTAEDKFSKRYTQLLRTEENTAKLHAEAERTLLRARERADKSLVSTNASTREAQLMGEVEKCMTLLQCSTCKNNMRTTVITKCLHTFCKSCIDSRISSRQRKCPACNISFSQGEVQPLYFQ